MVGHSSTKPSSSACESPIYNRFTVTPCGWTGPTNTHFCLLQGHQVQYVIVVPAQGLVIVRTGHRGGKLERGQTGIIPSEVYRFVDQAVKLVH